MNWYSRLLNDKARNTASGFRPDPVHWRKAARRTEACVRASGLFDATWYLVSYPDVRVAGIDPLRHFLTHGGREGRNPSPLFDTKAYVALYPDAATGQPLLHYLRYRDERHLKAPRVGATPRQSIAGNRPVTTPSRFTQRPVHADADVYSYGTAQSPQPLDADEMTRLRQALRQAGFEMDPFVSLILPGYIMAGAPARVGFSVMLRRLPKPDQYGDRTPAYRTDSYGRYQT